MPNINIISLPAFTTNYIHILENKAARELAIVDPGDAPVVQKYLQKRAHDGGPPARVIFLITHHHADHTGGLLELKKQTQGEVYGPAHEAIEGIDTYLEENVPLTILGQPVQVLFTPGHTRGHISYYFPGLDAVFTGDTLFSFGCGRLFEGTAFELWESLKKLRALPGRTRVYSAHEYTLDNLRFACALEPSNDDLLTLYAKLQKMGPPLVPTLMYQERQFNPFLRCDKPDFQQALGKKDVSAETLFAHIRQQKDTFK